MLTPPRSVCSMAVAISRLSITVNEARWVPMSDGLVEPCTSSKSCRPRGASGAAPSRIGRVAGHAEAHLAIADRDGREAHLVRHVGEGALDLALDVVELVLGQREIDGEVEDAAAEGVDALLEIDVVGDVAAELHEADRRHAVALGDARHLGDVVELAEILVVAPHDHAGDGFGLFIKG